MDLEIEQNPLIIRGKRYDWRNPFVIAEVGSNWKTLGDLKGSVRLAAASGADAVKFQDYTHAALYGPNAPGTTDYKFEREWHEILSDLCSKLDVGYMCTAFDPETMEHLTPYVCAHKIASSCALTPEFYQVAGASKLPTFISLGAKSSGDVEIAVGLAQTLEVKATFMYCVAAYPCREHNLFCINDLREKIGQNIGYSDHTLDVVYAPMMATRYHKAVALEKHVNFVGADSSDSPHSIDTDQLAKMVRYAKGLKIHQLLVKEETPMLLRHNNRLVAIEPISKGDKLIYGVNFAPHRQLVDDANGLAPYRAAEVDGKLASKDIAIQESIGPNEFLTK